MSAHGCLYITVMGYGENALHLHVMGKEGHFGEWQNKTLVFQIRLFFLFTLILQMMHRLIQRLDAWI